jgi:hypothetical protein
MFGGVGEFVWKYMCGFRFDKQSNDNGKANQTFLVEIEPFVMKNLSWVDCSKAIIGLGLFKSSWKLTNMNENSVCLFEWNVFVPANVGFVTLSMPLDLKNKERKKIQVGSGAYFFSVELNDC